MWVQSCFAKATQDTLLRQGLCELGRSHPCEALAKQGGGEGGIRTPDTVARTPHFECGAFNHSATSPQDPGGIHLGVMAFYPSTPSQTRVCAGLGPIPGSFLDSFARDRHNHAQARASRSARFSYGFGRNRKPQTRLKEAGPALSEHRDRTRGQERCSQSSKPAASNTGLPPRM